MRRDTVKLLVDIRTRKAMLALAVAASASNALPALAQAPAIGQAPAVGQAPAIGQAPAAAPTTTAPAAPAEMAAGDKPVSYSEDQATRGKETYTRVCADCHGDDLRGGLIGGPPLRGNAFDDKFANGSPASGLFGFISTQMPPDSPGQFSPAVYAELTAYILKQNGYPSGAALPADTDAFDYLLVQK